MSGAADAAAPGPTGNEKSAATASVAEPPAKKAKMAATLPPPCLSGAVRSTVALRVQNAVLCCASASLSGATVEAVKPLLEHLCQLLLAELAIQRVTVQPGAVGPVQTYLDAFNTARSRAETRKITELLNNIKVGDGDGADDVATSVVSLLNINKEAMFGAEGVEVIKANAVDLVSKKQTEITPPAPAPAAAA